MELQHQNRQVISDLTRMQRDLKSIMSVNEEYQMQAGQFKEREMQFNELGREYREKLELLKFEREKLAMKEEQFLRTVHKQETSQKSELKRTQERFESMMHARLRESDRKYEEMEDRLSRVQDEADDYRLKAEKLDKI